MIDLKNSEKLLNEKMFKDFELSFNVTLPKEFKELYLKFNGGSPSKRYYNGYQIAFFESIKFGDVDDIIETLIMDLKDEELLPKGFIPFAHDSGGWYFALDLNEANYGAVYVIRNDMGDDHPVFVAPSFKELLEGLTLEDDY